MKRRDFVKHASLASAGMLVAPALLANHGSLQGSPVVPIIQGGEHVRHGLFAPQAIQSRALPTWLKLFERHVFYGNGITPGTSDLQSFSFEVDGQSFTLARKGTETLFSSEEETHTIPANGSFAVYDSVEFEIRLKTIEATSTLSLEAHHPLAVIPIRGDAWMDRHTLISEFECCVINQGDVNQLKCADHAQLLIISRKTR